MAASANLTLLRHSRPHIGQPAWGTLHRRWRPVQCPAAATSQPGGSSSSPVKYTVSLWDALAFWGPAPETVNGRLAMVGFVNGVLHEVNSSETILQQVQTQLGPLTLAILAMWTVASLIPICKGVKNNEAFGPFSPQAEMVNGRAAMLGIVVLAFLEHKAGVPFF